MNSGFFLFCNVERTQKLAASFIGIINSPFAKLKQFFGIMNIGAIKLHSIKMEEKEHLP